MCDLSDRNVTGKQRRMRLCWITCAQSLVSLLKAERGHSENTPLFPLGSIHYQIPIEYQSSSSAACVRGLNWILSCVTCLIPASISLLRYHYLRGLVNTVSNRRLDALEDFQSLYKTDAEIFPSEMVKSLVDSLPHVERLQVSSGRYEWTFWI